MPNRGSERSSEYPELAFESAKEFSAWLRKNHETSDGIWLLLAKKGSGVASVTYAEALDEALCYGWIDGQTRSLDETSYRQKFTPRRARSMWSKRNREKVAALVTADRIRPAGQREIDRAKADGRWEAAYDSPSTAVVPEDLQRKLDRDAGAAALFSTLDSRNRYAILHRIQTAKKPETRARRIEKLVAMLKRGETPY